MLADEQGGIPSYKSINRQLFKIAIPIIFGQLGVVFMGVFDVMMLGWVGPTEQAAVGISNAVFFLFFTFAMGVCFSISPLVAIEKGKGNTYKSWSILKASLKVTLLMAIGLWLIYAAMTWVWPFLGQEQGVEIAAESYLSIVKWSVFPMLVFMAAKHYFDGLSRTIPASVITVVGLLANVVLNRVLIFGFGPIKPMGIEGAAIATNIVRFGMCLAIIWYLWRDRASVRYRYKSARFGGADFSYIYEVWKVGYPIGFQFFFEVSAFSLAAVMAGWIGEVSQAAHNIALHLASVTYMGATGLAAAGSVLAGQFYGSQNKWGILRVGKLVIGFTLLYMGICAMVFMVFRTAFASAFSNVPEVIESAASLLILAGLFQLSDGLQTTGMGLLRGMKDVRMPSVIAFFAYWVVGIPICYYLSFLLEMGVTGIWVGFIIGLTLAAICIMMRFFNLQKKLTFVT